VPDRGHHRRGQREHRPEQALVGERQQVLHRPAAARDHDDVDLRVAVEPAERGDDLGGGAGALHGGVHHPELDRRPAAPGHLQHVALRGRAAAGDQADAAGEERQRPLALLGEEPLGREQLATPLDAREQLAEPDHADVAGAQRERAAVGVERRLGVDHHARTLDDGRVERVEELARAGHGHRDVGDRVAQRHEDGVHALAAAELGDLALHPHGTEPIDPSGDQVGDLSDGRRLLG
jgi:hypothetical protein